MARKPPKTPFQLMFPLPQSCSHMVVAHEVLAEGKEPEISLAPASTAPARPGNGKKS